MPMEVTDPIRGGAATASAPEAGRPAGGSTGSGETRSDLSGSAGNVVQSRDILGGIHFHQPPAIPAAAGVPRQLPWDVRGFVGRTDELAWLDAIHVEHRERPSSAGLVVITGTAGVGKTALAVHWANQAAIEFPDGQLYVNLRGYDPAAPLGPMEALARFLRALGVSDNDLPRELEDRAERYRSLVAGRRMLMVLDNAATVGQIRPLLPGAGGCLVLVTSRDLLSGLAARDGARRLSLKLLTEQQAVNLVRAALADYRLADSDRDLALLAGLCARLPLALRIAAERAAARPAMPLTELIEDLRDESSLWEALSLQDEDEADAVRSVFAWSYRALPPAAARMFRLLGVHPGLDIGLPAVAALAAEPPHRARGLLDLLTRAHLVEQTGPNRYQFHDLLRAYAANQASQEPDEAHQARDRMLSWYLHTAHAAAAAMQTFRSSTPVDLLPAGAVPLAFTTADEATAWYQAEQDNLRAVGEVAVAAGLDRIAWQLPAVLHVVHAMRNPSDHWFALGRTGLTAARRLGDPRAQALMLTTLGVAYAFNPPRKFDRAADYLTEALELHRDSGDRFSEMQTTNALGIMYLRARRLPQAATYFEQARALACLHSDRRWEALAWGNLANVRLDEGHPAAAIDHLHRSLRLHAETNADPGPQIFCRLILARAHRELGQLGVAGEHLDAALSLWAAADPGDQAYARLEQGHLHHACGRFDDARGAYQQAANLYRSLGDRPREAWVLDAVGRLYYTSGKPDQAIDFHRRAVAVFAEYDRSFDQAAALDNLGAALAGTGESNAAREHWDQALALLEPFDDLRATGLREHIRASITTRRPGRR